MGRARMSRRCVVSVLALAVAAGCGGGDDADDADDGSPFGIADDSGDDADGDASADDAGADDGGAVGGTGGDGGVVLGEPGLTAEPGQVWAEVGGERLEYTTAGSINVQCSITSNQVTVNLQTAEGRSFLLQGADQGGWFLNMTFAPGGEEIRYGSESASGRGTYTIGDGVLSYEGTVVKVVDFDVANGEELDARVAVNCASPGGDPTAVVGGETYTFPVSGAQSVTCDVAPEAIEIRINRLALEGLQLEVNAVRQGDQWVGAVTVFRSDGNLTSTLPPDGTGLTVDGTTVSYQGTFVGPDGQEVDGTADVTC